MQTAVHVEDTEQKEHCGNSVELKFTMFYNELFNSFVRQSVVTTHIFSVSLSVNEAILCVLGFFLSFRVLYGVFVHARLESYKAHSPRQRGLFSPTENTAPELPETPFLLLLVYVTM